MAVNAEMAARMPWLQAEGESWWVVTGKVSERHTVTDCIAQVMPPMVTGVDEGDGLALFRVYVWTSELTLMSADRITHARRLVFVLADEPDRAYYTDEQDFIAAHRDRVLPPASPKEASDE